MITRLLRADDPYREVTDGRAIAEVTAGNREMFEVLMRRYNQQLFRVGMSYLRNPAQVEDAMQETYLKAFLHLRGFGRRSSASTWLTRIMINECLMTLRRLRRGPEVPLESVPETNDARAARAEPEFNLKEMKALLERAISDLPQGLRQVFILREVQQLSTAETAACLGISAGNVRVKLHRAHEQLKSELVKNAAAAELFSFGAPLCDPFTRRVMAAVLTTSVDRS